MQALSTNVTGDRNTALGRSALKNSTGSRNLAVGFKSGQNLTGGNDNVYLGSLGPSSLGIESNTLRLGSTQKKAFVAGVVGSGVSGWPVYVDGQGRLGLLSSSARVKHDIQTVGAASQALGSLRPVSFRYRNDPTGEPRYGLVAEEVAEVYPELVTRTPTGEVLGVDYPQLIPLLLNELQRQQRTVAVLEARQERREAEMARLRTALAPERQMAALPRR